MIRMIAAALAVLFLGGSLAARADEAKAETKTKPEKKHKGKKKTMKPMNKEEMKNMKKEDTKTEAAPK